MKTKNTLLYIYRIFILFLVIAYFPFSIGSHNSKHHIREKVIEKYDDSTKQKTVWTHEGIDSIINKLPSYSYHNLPNDYSVITKSLEQESVLKYKNYYKITGTEIFKFVVAHFRISDFMSKDTFYQSNMICLPGGCDQYWLMDPLVLHKFLDLLIWMREKGYNDSALSINNGHRNPAYNASKGGVSRSYHMQGKAIDLKVGDINRNGTADAEDKQILLDILEHEIIQDEGGLGKYPHSDVIHFDTRGFRARWDKQ